MQQEIKSNGTTETINIPTTTINPTNAEIMKKLDELNVRQGNIERYLRRIMRDLEYLTDKDGSI
jgi:hypothetical protein